MPRGSPRPPNAGKGRPKGSKNRAPLLLKEMVATALDGVGGADYLRRQAETNPSAFMALLGKLLPLTLQGPAEDGSHRITFVVEGVPAPRRDESPAS